MLGDHVEQFKWPCSQEKLNVLFGEVSHLLKHLFVFWRFLVSRISIVWLKVQWTVELVSFWQLHIAITTERVFLSQISGFQMEHMTAAVLAKFHFIQLKKWHWPSPTGKSETEHDSGHDYFFLYAHFNFYNIIIFSF